MEKCYMEKIKEFVEDENIVKKLFMKFKIEVNYFYFVL